MKIKIKEGHAGVMTLKDGTTMHVTCVFGTNLRKNGAFNTINNY